MTFRFRPFLHRASAMCRRHFWALVLACAVGLVIVAPPLAFRFLSGEYRGIELLRADGEMNYIAQAREAYDGHWTLGNIYLSEGKENPTFTHQPLPGIVMALAAKASFLTPIGFDVAAKFFLPFFLTLIVYAMFLLLTGRKDTALVGTAFTMAIPATLTFLDPGTLRDAILHGVFGTKHQFLSYSRPVNPQFSSFFFYGYFAALVYALYAQAISKRRRLGWEIASGVLLGLAFYTYFFAYSFIAVFTVILFVWFLATRERMKALQVLRIGLLGLVVAIPFFLNLADVIRSPVYAAVSERLGALIDHGFVFSRVWWGGALLFILVFKFLSSRQRAFIGTFLATAFILTNQQVLTGRVIPQYSHYHWYYIAPFVGAFIVLFTIELVRRHKKRAAFWCSIVAVALFAIAAVGYQIRSYLVQVPPIVAEQRYADVLGWLERSTPNDAVVFADMRLSSDIVSYTHNNVYAHENLVDFPLPESELRHRLFAGYVLDGIGKDDPAAGLAEKRNDLGAFLYGQYYRQQFGCYGCFSDERFQEIVQDYSAFQKQGVLTQLRKYPIDYIVWDTQMHPSWEIDTILPDAPVYESEGLKVYHVPRP